MAKIAVDVALLPPEEVMDVAVSLNQKYNPKFELSKNDRRPHITLSQAVLNSSDLEKASSRLEKLAKKFKPLTLTAKIVNDPDSFFRVSPTEEILALHRAIMDSLEDLVSYDAISGYFLGDEILPSSVAWVNNFKTDSAFDNFDPHISIGVNEKVEKEYPLSFIANWLAICRLGNYNTCRKILWETRLK